MFNLIANYLSNRKQRVKVAGSYSSTLDITKGVPQGSILGPAFFNVLMNDVFYCVNDGHLSNYADDNSVLVSAKSKGDLITKLISQGETLIDWCEVNEMEANPSKFELLVSNESSPVSIEISNTTITSSKYAKLLGITIDNRLTFTEHISNLIRKSSRQLNCLKRLSKYLDTKTKLSIYKTFILSNFNYCPTVWHCCGIQNTKKLEKVQHRALKFIYEDYTSEYDTLLKKANLPTLELQRLCAIATEVFKAYNSISPQYVCDIFQKPKHNYSLRAKNTLFKTSNTSTKGGLHSFKHVGTTIWNSLPNELRTTTDYSTFKKLINTWSGISCKCSFCKN